MAKNNAAIWDISTLIAAGINPKTGLPIKMGAVSGTMHQIIKKPDGQISAEADVTWACVNHEAHPSRIPPEFMVDGLKPESN